MGIDISQLGKDAQAQVMAKMAVREVQKREKRSKYRSKFTPRVMPNGKVHKFKSAKEARRYDELALMERRGLIRNLQIERAFTLQEPYIHSDGEHV